MTAKDARGAVPWLVSLTLVGAALRLAAAGQALLGDELYTWHVATQPGLRDVWHALRETENTPPLTYVLSWLVAKAADTPELVRAPAVVAGIALVPAVGWTAARCFGARAGAAAAALAAFSPFAVYYASEARAYAPAAFGVALALLCLVEALAGGRRAWWVGVALAAAGAMWSHYTAVFPLAAAAAWTLWAAPAARRPALAAFGAATLLYVPWLPYLQASAGLLILSALSPLTTGSVPSGWLKTAVGHPYRDLSDVPGFLVLAALGALIVWGAIAAWRARDEDLRPRAPGGLLALVAVAAPAGVALYSLLATSIYNPRNIYVSAPALLALAGAVLARVRFAPAIAGALLALWALQVVGPPLRRPPYDQAAAFVDRVAAPRVPVLEVPAVPAPGPLREHLSVNFARPHRLLQSDLAATRAWEAGLAAGRVVTVVPEDGGFASLPAPRDPRFELLERRDFEGIADVTVEVYEPRR